MDNDFGRMLATLGETQQIVLMALNAVGDGAQADPGNLRLLLGTVSDLADQADTLMAKMLEGDADDSLLTVAEALFEFFQDTEARLEAMLRAGQG